MKRRRHKAASLTFLANVRKYVNWRIFCYGNNLTELTEFEINKYHLTITSMFITLNNILLLYITVPLTVMIVMLFVVRFNLWCVFELPNKQHFSTLNSKWN